MIKTSFSDYNIAEGEFTLEEMEYIKTVVNSHIQKMKVNYDIQNSDFY